jgi:hypothetical protein
VRFLDSITTTNDVIIDQITEQPKPQRRKSVKSRNSSITQNHEPLIATVTKALPLNNKKRRISISLKMITYHLL